VPPTKLVRQRVTAGAWMGLRASTRSTAASGRTLASRCTAVLRGRARSGRRADGRRLGGGACRCQVRGLCRAGAVRSVVVSGMNAPSVACEPGARRWTARCSHGSSWPTAWAWCHVGVGSLGGMVINAAGVVWRRSARRVTESFRHGHPDQEARLRATDQGRARVSWRLRSGRAHGASSQYERQSPMAPNRASKCHECNDPARVHSG